ncbi:MAG: NCS2 family permease, partial [Methanomassiliicoccales archaeon]|nr:NCS2 family permease [Methanomassiliicoccales archaeon]
MRNICREHSVAGETALKLDDRREIIAGATIFMTMAYIIIVNPVILSAAGIPFGPAMVATIMVAGIATLACGLYAKRPFALAPYMGENAFLAYSVVIALSVTWNVALGAVFIAGLLFLLFSLSGLRKTLLDAIPPFLSATWGVAIGLFLLFIGLANAGISLPGVPGAPLAIGDLARPEVIVVLIGIAITLYLHIKKVVGSVLLGMAVTLALGFVLGGLGYGTTLPTEVPSLFGPIPDWGEVLFKMDVVGALNLTLLPIILVMFLMDFLDTAGTVLGLGAKAGFLDEKGKLPGMDKVVRVDAAATVMAGVFGTSTTGVFIESATGIEQGGRTGRTAVVAG